MKEITKEELNILIENNVVKNSNRGFLGQNNYKIGFYRTRHKRYMEDRYVDRAKRLSSKTNK